MKHIEDLKQQTPISERMVDRKSYMCTYSSKCMLKCIHGYPHAHKTTCNAECDECSTAKCVRNEASVGKRIDREKINAISRKSQRKRHDSIKTKKQTKKILKKKQFNHLYVKEWSEI